MKVLDLGCNTGKNMSRAKTYSSTAEVFGIEYSADSVGLARALHGQDHVFQGDASMNFVDEHSWAGAFDAVQCTAVIQHMTPQQVESCFGHIARCLAIGGEFLLTFKDAPTKQQLREWSMDSWVDEVFTSDLVSREEYSRDGFIRAVMWDDDYYPGVTTDSPPETRDLSSCGIHRREFVFYSLEWVKSVAKQHGLLAKHLEVQTDSKIPFSAFHWMIVFQLME